MPSPQKSFGKRRASVMRASRRPAGDPPPYRPAHFVPSLTPAIDAGRAGIAAATARERLAVALIVGLMAAIAVGVALGAAELSDRLVAAGQGSLAVDPDHLLILPSEAK